MKAIQYYGPQDIKFEDVTVKPPQDGEIVVKVMSALTCGTDVKTYRRGHPVLIKNIPSGVGHEFSGIVDRIGTKNLIGIYTNFINKTFSGMIGSSDFDTTVETVWRALTVLSTEDEAKGYHSLTEYFSESELEQIHQALPALLYPILEFVAQDYKNYSQDHAGTLAYNALRLLVNHYQEVPAAWARSYDSYYDNDTNPVTLKEGTGGKEAPHYPAVEVKSFKTGKVTTYDNPSNVIDVDARDEIRIVPKTIYRFNTSPQSCYQAILLNIKFITCIHFLTHLG